jgi:hypothetical protein
MNSSRALLLISFFVFIAALGSATTAGAQNCRFLLDGCDQRGEPQKQAPNPPPRSESIEILIDCCLSYCRLINCNAPPAAVACGREFISSSLTKFASSWLSYGGTAIYGYKRNFLENARSFRRGAILPECQ